MNLAELGKRIKSQRLKRQLTQSQLANSLYISAQAVSKWERGENAPDISLLPKISLLLGRSIEWIISGEDRNHSTFPATILYTSMRSFLKKSGAMSPEAVALWMNGIFHSLTEAALLHDGVPVKYTGDGFLAYFADTKQQDRALKAAKTMAEAITEEDLLVTVHCGNIYLGTIGHPEFAAADIIGETVNSTFIINRWATEESKATVVLSEHALELIEEVRLKTERINTGLKGIPTVFELS